MLPLSTRSMLVVVAAAAFVSAAGCKKDAPKPAEPPKTEEAKPAEMPAEASPAAAPAEASPVAAAASPTDAPAGATPAAGAGADAVSVLTPGQKFEFSLKDSPETLAFHNKRCADESKGDAAKQQACMDGVTKAVEGMRLEKEGDALFMVMYGTKADGTEEIQLRGPIAKIDSPANQFKFKPTGPCTGTVAAERGLDKFDAAKAEQMVMTIDVVDAMTISMANPQKGHLFFKKK